MTDIRFIAIRTHEHERFVRDILERDAEYFHFDSRVDLASAAGPEQWNMLVVTPAGTPVGFGRLRYQTNVGVLVATYCVAEAYRRQGIGTAILDRLHTLATSLGHGFGAAVYALNRPSLALCTKHFGRELYRGEVEGKEVVVFGDYDPAHPPTAHVPTNADNTHAIGG